MKKKHIRLVLKMKKHVKEKNIQERNILEVYKKKKNSDIQTFLFINFFLFFCHLSGRLFNIHYNIFLFGLNLIGNLCFTKKISWT